MRKRVSPFVAVVVEGLEGRRLCSSTGLRIVSYNVEDDIDGYTTPRPGLDTVLEGIGAYTIGSTARPIDVLALTETTSNAATVAPIVADLNSYYGAGTYAASTLQLSESGGDAADGNGPSALIYDTKTVQLLASVGLSGTLGSSTGVYRQVGRYELEPVGGTSAGAFYLYVDHYKSGTGSTNAKDRGEEAAVVRADEATLPSTARVVYAGDFNTNADGEAIFETLMGSGQGQAFDALDPSGGVGNVEQGVGTYTESATALQYRDDYQMVTDDVLTSSAGLELVGGTEQAFGNNGSVAADGSVTASSNTALAGLSNRSAVLSALTTASDHLPVVADYTDVATAAGGAISGTVSGGKAGETVYLDANNNSTLDAGERSTTTSSTGAYGFTGVTPGAYIVRQVLPAGYAQTSPSDGYGIHLTVAAGSSFTGEDFTDVARRTGTTIGTSGSYTNDGNTIAKATDGNLGTFYDGVNANGDYVGLDLGSAESVSVIEYAPRSGYASRMVGGVFQASNTAGFTSGVVTLATVTATPATGTLTTVTLGSPVSYRYFRYLSPNGSYGNVAEVQFFG